MSTAEWYSIHAYCDEPGCTARCEFYGVNKTDAYEAAAIQGWYISLRKQAPKGTIGGSLSYCPNHRT